MTCERRKKDTNRLNLLPIVLVTIAATLVAGGCETQKTSDRDLSLISPNEVDALLAPRRGGVLGVGRELKSIVVDARTLREFRAGHIPGAISLPYGEVQARRGELAGFATIIVYGGTYNDPVATGMSKTLLEMGVGDVRTLRGGIEAWQEAGRLVEQGP